MSSITIIYAIVHVGHLIVMIINIPDSVVTPSSHATLEAHLQLIWEMALNHLSRDRYGDAWWPRSGSVLYLSVLYFNARSIIVYVVGRRVMGAFRF